MKKKKRNNTYPVVLSTNARKTIKPKQNIKLNAFYFKIIIIAKSQKTLNNYIVYNRFS